MHVSVLLAKRRFFFLQRLLQFVLGEVDLNRSVLGVFLHGILHGLGVEDFDDLLIGLVVSLVLL